MLAALTSEGPLNAARGGTDRKQRRRLTLCCAASVLLHALALAVNPPSGTGFRGAADGGGSNVLYAILSPLYAVMETDAAEATSEALPDAALASRAEPAPHDSGRPTSSHAITAASFPVPDYWLPADELSVRAEPLTDVQIDYPAELADRGVVGRVTLLLHIDEHGFVRRTHVEESIPEGVFDRATLAAWAEVRFSPAVKDGMAVKSRKRLEISFLP